jgi:4-amino-4-deoxy-L-arabinose transferase-like glycosyltransferase
MRVQKQRQRSGSLRLKSILKPSPDQPLPVWMIYPVIFVVLYASHFALLRLPYYWDEAGYYIPAAWDFFCTGSLIPFSTLTNAHPPLPSVYLALWWRVAGFVPEVTREAVLMVAALGLLAVWRLAMRLVGVASVAFWTVLLTGLYPVWFAQSTLAHADIFAAACSLWGLVYALPGKDRKPWAAALWFSAAALAKETSIAIPLMLAALALAEGLLHLPERKRLWREAAWLGSCLLPLAGWYAYHRAKTGFLFGNPEFLRYNAQATLAPLRILAAFGHRLLHLTVHMNLFVPVTIGLAAMLLDPKSGVGDKERENIGASERVCIFALLLSNALFFSVLGGALLTRYLLPMFPLVLLLVVTTMYRRAPYWQGLALVSAGAFLVGLFVNPPYGFAPEDNLQYARTIRLHQAAIAQLNKFAPGATVLTAWPASDELRRPELGYVKQAWDVFPIDDFSVGSIALAARQPDRYSAALVFSTKYDPPSPWMRFTGELLDEQYFGLHHDLTPERIARQLDGAIVWSRSDGGMWAAVIRFDRAAEARLER